jgi:GxxExxY protein
MPTDNVTPIHNDPDTYAIIGAAMAVHTETGCGFNERIYREALSIEFKLRGILFQREVIFAVSYKGHELPGIYKADFVCNGVLIECKAVKSMLPVHEAQLINYLKASRLKRALLINFGGRA